MTDNDPTTYADDGADLTADGGDVLSAAENLIETLTLAVVRHYGYTDDDVAFAESIHPGRVCVDECYDEDGKSVHPGVFDELHATASVMAEVVEPIVTPMLAAARAAADEEARGRLAAGEAQVAAVRALHTRRESLVYDDEDCAERSCDHPEPCSVLATAVCAHCADQTEPGEAWEHLVREAAFWPCATIQALAAPVAAQPEGSVEDRIAEKAGREFMAAQADPQPDAGVRERVLAALDDPRWRDDVDERWLEDTLRAAVSPDHGQADSEGGAS